MGAISSPVRPYSPAVSSLQGRYRPYPRIKACCSLELIKGKMTNKASLTAMSHTCFLLRGIHCSTHLCAPIHVHLRIRWTFLGHSIFFLVRPGNVSRTFGRRARRRPACTHASCFMFGPLPRFMARGLGVSRMYMYVSKGVFLGIGIYIFS